MLRISILCIIILLTAGILRAQNYNDNRQLPNYSENTTHVWKRRVSRLIDTRYTLDEKGNLLKNEFGDTMLAKLLVDAVMKKQIKAYEYYDSRFEDKIDLSQLNKTIHPELDTLDKSDYHSPFTYSAFFRIIEDWVYYPLKRETEIHIIGIDPMHDLYGAGGIYRGHTGTLNVKWTDFLDIYHKYCTAYPENTFLKSLFDDNFKYPGLYPDTQSIQSPLSGEVWRKIALRDIEVRDTDYWENPHFYDAGDNNNLFGELLDSIQKKKLNVYSDFGERFSHKLLSNEVGFGADVDTEEVINPVTGEKELKVTTHDFDPEWFHKYTVLESWSFDPPKGKAKVKILGIEPRLDKTGLRFIRYDNLYWVRYEDILSILQHLDEYHPLNNLSTALWRSYFQPQTAK